ncbi:MAG: suppressor of fused domain protein, partial [Lachnospiraceae bacterium]|nr:suppressor of fused domain protein [Lachnospiraceae bacterium]
TVQGNVDGSAYAQNTGFNSVILDYATKNDEIIVYRMSSGRVINFYQIYPLYPEELKFKFDYNAEMLFNMFDTNGVNYKVLDVNRRNIFK